MPCEVSPPEGNPRDANGGVDPVGEGPRPGAGQDAALPLLHENGSGRALCVPPRGHGSGNGQAETGPSLPLLLSARGSAGAVLVGADCPVLSAPLVRAAFRELASSAGAVFGPSDDGGFYLIALSSTAPSLFRGVNWGTGSVLSEVCLQCRAAGIPYALLPPGFDIDTADDVTALARWTRGHSSPACPRTRQWLTSRGEG